jgi:hypothetical protein
MLATLKKDSSDNKGTTLMSKSCLNKNHVQAFVIDEIKSYTTTTANAG